MHYRDIADLNTDARRLAEHLPHEVDLVAGIPRSGLLPANVLCLHLDVPMTDVDGLCEGEVFETGRRFDRNRSFEAFDSVLVVDDSVCSGNQMSKTKNRLAEHDFPFDVYYGAVYVSPTGHGYVDYWSDVVSLPRVFEWNVIHHTMMDNFCVDIDGVLCRDPTPEENDDGENYRTFITEVEPNIIPSQRIGWLVTCRLEKYREETEQWLDTHGIEYDNLVMMDLPDKETRQKLGSHAAYKAEVYDSTSASLFIESDRTQATEICERTNKPVFCYEDYEMLRPGQIPRMYRKSRDTVSGIARNPLATTSTLCKRYLSLSYHRIKRSL